MVPGLLRQVTPSRSANPERGRTCPAYPSGMASRTPVGTSARSPGVSVTARSARRSRPAAPEVAYEGSGAGSPREGETRVRWMRAISGASYNGYQNLEPERDPDP